MRAGLLTFAVLVATASAAPRDRRHKHLRAHDKRAPDAVDIETDVAYVTATAPQVIVYVDGNGNPVSTAYNGPSAPQPTPYSPPESTTNQPGGYAPPAYASPTSTPAAITPAEYTPPLTPSIPSTPEPQAPASTPASAEPSTQESANGTIIPGRGVTYTPYTSDGGLKGQDQVTSDIASIDGYSLVRIYDTNSGQVGMLIEAVKPKSMKLFVGFNDVTNVVSDTQAIIDDAAGNWDSIHTVAVGNEAVFRGAAASDVVDAMATARKMLRAAGYPGYVITVESNSILLQSQYADLCQNSDYTAANIHPWYDVNTAADEAGTFVAHQKQLIAANCGVDPSNMVVTETGWPWQGTTHGDTVRMVASTSDQTTAIDSLQSAMSDNIIFLSAFDELWKAPGGYDCEQYWGILEHNTS